MSEETDTLNFFSNADILTTGSNSSGGWETATNDYILVSIDTDQQTLVQLQHSHDTEVVDYTDSVTYDGSGTPQNYIYSRKGEFVQIRLENTGGSDQTELRCYLEFISSPATSNVISSIVTGSNIVVDQQDAGNLHVLSHGSNNGGSTSIPILVNDTGALVTTGSGTIYPSPLTSYSITNDPVVLRDGSGIFRGYHITSALSTHAIIGVYDSNNANAVTAANTPLVPIPVSKSGDVGLMLDGGGVSFSNGITVRGCSTFDISRNVHVDTGALAGTFYYTSS